MISFSRLGYRGNLGNQLFQIASIISLSKKHNQNYCFPKWKYADYFDYKFNVGYIDETFTAIKELKYEFHQWEINNGNFDLDGWFQSEKYFNKSSVREVFKFKEDLIKEVLLKNKYLFEKKCVIISVRRGDFVFHPYFHQLDFDYYFKALINCFPDYKNKNLIFTSDDINYCKKLFGFLPNSYFLNSHSPIEQLIISSQCKDFIISNSTFSWWLAWFGERENSKIIRPLKNFRGDYAKNNNEIDYFPQRWEVFNDKIYDFPKGFTRLKFIGNYLYFLNYMRYNIGYLKNTTIKNLKRILKK